MRVIVFCSGNLDTGSGSPMRARLIAKGLHDLGVNVVVIATNVPKIFAELGIKSYLLPDNKRAWLKIIEQAAQEFDPDIIYGITEGHADLVRKTGRKYNCKIAYDLHGIGLVEILELGGGYGSRLIRSWNSLRWLYAASKADLVTVANPTLVPIIKWLNRHTVPVIGMADTSKFSPDGPRAVLGNHSNKLQVLYAGNFYKWQGIQLLIGAIKLVLEKSQEFEFTILGSTGKSQKLVDDWKKQLPADVVHFRDSVDFDEIGNYYRGADILMIPRPFMLSTYLAIPQKITEYMLSQKAIVATNLAPHRWALGGNPLCGILCRPNSKDIANALLQARDGKLREEVGKNARIRALEWFNHDKQCRIIYQAFRDLMQTTGNGFKTTGKIIFDGGNYSEDFLVVKDNARYVAFYTHGTEQAQYLHSAVADSPLGPFTKLSGPLHDSKMRLGSIISPCPQTQNKWRIYFNKLIDYNHRVLCYIESDDLTTWKNETRLNIVAPENDPSGRLNIMYTQPCCRLINGVFFLAVNKATKSNDGTVDFSVIDSFTSKDGLNFESHRAPLIKPMANTLYSLKIGNPKFIFDKNKIVLLAEGNTGPGWHLFRFDITPTQVESSHQPLFNSRKILANPAIEKFDDKYYLYYGELINGYYRVKCAVSNDL